MDYADDILDSIDEAIFKLDKEHKILYLNDCGRNLWGAESAWGKPFNEFAGKEESEIVAKAIALGERVSAVIFSSRMGRWINFSARPVKNHVLIIFYPVEHPEKTGPTLPSDEWCFRKAEEMGHVGSFEWRLQDNKIYWTDELYIIHGLKPQSEEITFDRVLSLIHPDDRDRVLTAITEFQEMGKPLDIIHRIVRDNGTVRQVRRTGELVLDEDGTLIKVYGSIQDLTEQLESQEKSRASEDLLKESEIIGQIGSYAGEFETMKFQFSDGMYRLLGYKSGDFIPTLDFIESVSHPEDIEKVRTIIEHARISCEPYEYDRRIFRPDGEMRYLHSRGKVFVDEHGKAVKFLGIVQDITEQKRVQDEIAKSKSLLQGVFDASTFAITVFESIRDDEGKITDFKYMLENEVARSFWKNGRIGQGFLQLFPNAKNIGLFDLLKGVVDSGEPLDRELKINGEILNGWYRLTAIKLGDGLLTIAENVTVRKQHEEELAKNFYILSNREAVTKSGSWEYDPEKDSLVWSQGMYSIFGIQPGTDVDIGIYLEYVVSEDLEKAQILIKHIKNARNSVEEIITVVIDEKPKTIQIKAVPLISDGNKIPKMIGIDFDLTEKVIAEAELKQQDNFITQIAEATPDLISVFDIKNHSFSYANRQLYRFTGYKPQDLTGLSISKIRPRIHPADWNAFQSFFEDFTGAQGEEIREIDYRVKNTRNKWRWLRSRAKVFQMDKDGTVSHVISIAQDITAKKLVRRRLEKQNHFIREITRATPDTICIFDLRNRAIIYYNRDIYNDVEKVAGSAAITFDSLKKNIHPEDFPKVVDFLEAFKDPGDREVREIEYRLKNSEGKWVWLKSRAKQFKQNKEGEIIQIICITQDCTKEKEAEERMRENEFMQALLKKKDEFMSVASHELKTPITTIKASLQVLQRQIEKRVDQSVLLVFIKKATLQINKLINLIGDLMDNTKIQAGKMSLNISTCFITDIISDTLLHSFEDNKIIVVNHVDEPVQLDKIRIEQVLTNFLSNAIKYSPGSKEVILEVVKENDFLKVTVRDFGIGIPKEKIGQVFDRFFRVDEASAQFTGLGLGLYISSEIIKLHNGQYGVESEEGKGSAFWFKVPLKYQESSLNVSSATS